MCIRDSHAPYASLEELEAVLARAGFRVERWKHSGMGNAFLDDGRIELNTRQGMVAVTRPK